MDSSVSPKDETWFLRVWHHISADLYAPSERWIRDSANTTCSVGVWRVVYLNRRGRQFSRLLAAEVCASAVVMLDIPRSEVVWRVMATHCIRQFPLHFPSRGSRCAITFQLDSTTSIHCFHKRYEYCGQLFTLPSLWRRRQNIWGNKYPLVSSKPAQVNYWNTLKVNSAYVGSSSTEIKSPFDSCLLQSDTNNIRVCGISYYMNLNINKTRAISFCTKAKWHGFDNKFCESSISGRDSIRDLGVLTDTKLHFHQQLDIIFSHTVRLLRLIRNLNSSFSSLYSLLILHFIPARPTLLICLRCVEFCHFFGYL